MGKTTKDTAIAVRKNTLPANWEQKMKEDAQRYKTAEDSVSIGQFMSIKGGILAFQGTPVPGNKLRCVVLEAILENTYYEGEYDQDNPSSPVCFAFGRVEEEMAPHDKAPKPQHEGCASCEWNKFGTAEKGRGKACKNSRRMAIMHADSLDGDLKDAQVAFLKIPPTSLPSWAQYVKQLNTQLGRPPYAVITELSVVGDPRSQFKVTFTLVEVIKDKKLLGAVYAKHQEVADGIDFPYQPMEAAPKPARGVRRTAPSAAPARTPARGKSTKAAPPPARARGGFGAPAKPSTRF